MAHVANVMGHAISKLLNASNLASLAAKVSETLRDSVLTATAFPTASTCSEEYGCGGGGSAQADRVKTAKAVKALIAACDGKEPTKLVGAISLARLQTNSTTMGRGLKSAGDVLECLRTTRWDLFSAVSASEAIVPRMRPSSLRIWSAG